VIAILGATGYIGRSLARRIARSGDRPLALFARDPSRLADEPWPASVSLRELDSFDASGFDLVINAIGPGDPGRVQALGGDILEISESWDRRVLTTMAARTRYVFLSSGAVYGAFDAAADENSVLRLPINRLQSVLPYMMAKLCAEARHRCAPQRAILDLRVFAYADAAISRDAGFFLADLARSIADNTPFRTSPDDMVRDYAGAEELSDLIGCWSSGGAPNLAADLYSVAPVSKSVLLQAARDRYGLVIANAPAGIDSPTGRKPVYASCYRIAETFGYSPRRSSLDIVLSVLDRVAVVERLPLLANGPRRIA
jgi:nucleoside-diphosphate-sugar epimerase